VWINICTGTIQVYKTLVKANGNYSAVVVQLGK